MTVKTGAFVRSGGKWTPTIIGPDGVAVVIGEFATRNEATAAYKKRHRELYPVPPSPEIDPARHYSLLAGDVVTSPFDSTTLH